MNTYKFQVAMSCSGCSGAVTRALKRVEGISEMNVDLDQQLVTVVTDLEQSEIYDVISKTGKDTKILA